MLGLEQTHTTQNTPASSPSAPEQWSALMDDCIISIAWSPDGAQLSAASVSGRVDIFDIASGTSQQSLQAHQFGATALAWHPAGEILASAGQDGRIRIWNSQSGELAHELEGGSHWVEHLAWSTSGKHLATAAGRVLRLWGTDGKLVREYPEHSNTIAAIAWRPNASELASACYGQIRVWLPDSETPARNFLWKGSMLALAWSPDGRYLCHGNQDSTVHFWIVRNAKELQMWGYPTKVRELAWDRHSRYLATGGGTEITIWDCGGKGPENTKPIVLKLHQKTLSQLVYQRNGPLLASGCTGGRIAVWNPGKGKSKEPVFTAALSSAITQLAWSPSGEFLAAASEDGRLAVFSTGKLPGETSR